MSPYSFFHLESGKKANPSTRSLETSHENTGAGVRIQPSLVWTDVSWMAFIKSFDFSGSQNYHLCKESVDEYTYTSKIIDKDLELDNTKLFKKLEWLFIKLYFIGFFLFHFSPKTKFFLLIKTTESEFFIE